MWLVGSSSYLQCEHTNTNTQTWGYSNILILKDYSLRIIYKVPIKHIQYLCNTVWYFNLCTQFVLINIAYLVWSYLCHYIVFGTSLGYHTLVTHVNKKILKFKKTEMLLWFDHYILYTQIKLLYTS